MTCPDPNPDPTGDSIVRSAVKWMASNRREFLFKPNKSQVYETVDELNPSNMFIDGCENLVQSSKPV